MQCGATVLILGIYLSFSIQQHLHRFQKLQGQREVLDLRKSRGQKLVMWWSGNETDLTLHVLMSLWNSAMFSSLLVWVWGLTSYWLLSKPRDGLHTKSWNMQRSPILIIWDAGSAGILLQQKLHQFCLPLLCRNEQCSPAVVVTQSRVRLVLE